MKNSCPLPSANVSLLKRDSLVNDLPHHYDKTPDKDNCRQEGLTDGAAEVAGRPAAGRKGGGRHAPLQEGRRGVVEEEACLCQRLLTSQQTRRKRVPEPESRLQPSRALLVTDLHHLDPPPIQHQLVNKNSKHEPARVILDPNHDRDLGHTLMSILNQEQLFLYGSDLLKHTEAA